MNFLTYICYRILVAIYLFFLFIVIKNHLSVWRKVKKLVVGFFFTAHHSTQADLWRLKQRRVWSLAAVLNRDKPSHCYGNNQVRFRQCVLLRWFK